jgi:addiction module HigA family antidote
MAKLKPIHPGEILREEFMKPFDLNANKLSLALHVPAPGIYEIVKEERGISSEMALRLARFFKTTPEFTGKAYHERATPSSIAFNGSLTGLISPP